MRPRIGFQILAICLGGFLLASCAQHDIHHALIISVPDQKMVVYNDSQPVAEYAVSTSKYGVGDHPGSRETPLGLLVVEKKFGDNVPPGGVMKSRRFTGEILRPDAPGRDPIVTRVLWLKGLDAGNRNAFNRCIYIHGTPVERDIGKPASYGCIRMRSGDIINLYNSIGVGTKVEIINTPLPPPAGQSVAQVQFGG
jgi:lipoprotein-anchoring transpeptidase ErfK/SrfK